MIELSGKPSRDSERTLPLPEGEVHIWLSARTPAQNSDAFLRPLLSRYLGLVPQELVFECGEYGKPFLVNGPRNLQFNLSHTADWFACAVAHGVQVGLDLERCEHERETMKLARRFYSPREQAALAALDRDSQRQLFYDLWTLKESWVKARGGALGKELESTGFRLDLRPGKSTGRITAMPAPGPDAAFCCLLQALPGYALALCALLPSVTPPRMRLYRLHASGEKESLPLCLRAGSHG